MINILEDEAIPQRGDPISKSPIATRKQYVRFTMVSILLKRGCKQQIYRVSARYHRLIGDRYLPEEDKLIHTNTRSQIDL